MSGESVHRGGLVLGPVAVRRRCRLSGAVLEDLGSDQVWRAAGAVAAAEDACSEAGSELADALGPLVPSVSRPERQDLLRARRDAFNARALSVDPTVWADASTTAYVRALADRDIAELELDTALSELARVSGAAVDRALADPDLAWSVELSVPDLLKGGSVGALDPARSRKRRRRALTLLRMVQRAASKPSPFARFTTTTLLFPDPPSTPPRSHLRVDRGVIEGLRSWVADGGYRDLRVEHLWVTVNPSALVEETESGLRVSWLVTGDDGTDRFASARCGSEFVRTLHALRSPARLSTLLGSASEPSPRLTELIARGLLEIGIRLPSHGRHTLGAAAETLVPAREDDDHVTEAHRRLCALRDIEERTDSTGPVTVRRAEEAVSALTEGFGGAGARAHRAWVSEDVTGTGTDDGVRRIADGVLRDVGRVQRIVPLLSSELPFQMAGALAFERCFGTAEVPAPKAYRWFTESGRDEADAMLAECAVEELTAVVRLRDRLVDGLRAKASESDGTEAACDPELLEGIAADLPNAVKDMTCAAWPVQIADYKVVLNGVGAGHGRFAARVGADLDESRLAQLRSWASDAQTPLPGGLAVDVSALLGATVNEHPQLLPASLAYPGRALECDARTRIDLAECVVRASGGQLLLFSERFPDRPILPVPHNATLSTVAPRLYRWLCRFGPVPGATLDLWDLVDAGVTPADQRTDVVRTYPRLTLGGVVLCRRTWKVSAGSLPDTVPGRSNTVAWHRWCARTGVPRRSFLRTATLPDVWDVVRGLAEKHPVIDARSRSGTSTRKPSYVDLSQPLCWPSLDVPPGTTLTFTEPLPDPAHGHPTEYVLETSQPPRARTEN